LVESPDQKLTVSGLQNIANALNDRGVRIARRRVAQPHQSLGAGVKRAGIKKPPGDHEKKQLPRRASKRRCDTSVAIGSDPRLIRDVTYLAEIVKQLNSLWVTLDATYDDTR
jgi:hypothetical protein